MDNGKKDNREKIGIFRRLFTGLSHVYGTYDPATGRVRQVKAPVTKRVLLDHLTGRQPYGVYLLNKDRTNAIVADFDTENRVSVMDFVSRAKHYGISAYVERSKSKGYHAWIFFETEVPAFKARLVVQHILEEIDEPDTEVFPKQDRLNTNLHFGNFLNAPLFGALVPHGKTVFVDPLTFDPCPNQWDLLDSVHRIGEHELDEIIELNNLSSAVRPQTVAFQSGNKKGLFHVLPSCAQKILSNGVASYQRVVCFRLAVHFKRLGLPHDLAVAALKSWALKNRPPNGKSVIRDTEILSQASDAYSKSYAGYGCQTPAIKPFCDTSCHVNKWSKTTTNQAGESKYKTETSSKTKQVFMHVDKDEWGPI